MGTSESLRWPREYEARASEPSFRAAGRRYYLLEGPERCPPKPRRCIFFVISGPRGAFGTLSARLFTSPRRLRDSMTQQFQIIFGRRRFRLPLVLFFVVIAFVSWISYTVGFLHGRVDGFPGRSAAMEPQIPRPLQAAPPADFPLRSQLGKQLLGEAGTLEGIEEAREGMPPSATGANLESGPDPPRESQAESVFAETRSSRAGAVRSIYLQVAAARTRLELRRVLTGLESKGYQAIVDESENDGWVRALIGPVAHDESVSDLQRELSEAGFVDSFPRKR